MTEHPQFVYDGDKPFNPAVGDIVIATDAYGEDHRVTVVRGPWGGRPERTFVKVTVRFDSGAEMPWPLSAVRPAEEMETP